MLGDGNEIKAYPLVELMRHRSSKMRARPGRCLYRLPLKFAGRESTEKVLHVDGVNAAAKAPGVKLGATFPVDDYGSGWTLGVG